MPNALKKMPRNSGIKTGGWPLANAVSVRIAAPPARS